MSEPTDNPNRWRDINPLANRLGLDGHDVAPVDAPAWVGRNNQLFNAVRDPRRNVEINVGKACNNKCVFCMDGLPKTEDRSYMPWPRMREEITQWAQAGSRSIGFLGGEPTTYRFLPDAIAHARDMGFTRIAIATNANRLRKAHYVDRLLDAGLSRVTVSMHAHTAALEDRLTRVPGQFEKKVAALQLLRARQQQGLLQDGVSVNVVLNGWNHRYLPHMLRFFFDTMGLDDLRANYMRPEGYAEGNAELCAPFHEVVPNLVKAIVLNEGHFRKTFTFGGFPLCVLPRQLRDNEALLRRYMGEYRDLSTDCSIAADGPGFGIEQIDGERSRFNWQERKRFDLKAPVEACRRVHPRPALRGHLGGLPPHPRRGRFFHALAAQRRHHPVYRGLHRVEARFEAHLVQPQGLLEVFGHAIALLVALGQVGDAAYLAGRPAPPKPLDGCLGVSRYPAALAQ